MYRSRMRITSQDKMYIYPLYDFALVINAIEDNSFYMHFRVVHIAPFMMVFDKLEIFLKTVRVRAIK